MNIRNELGVMLTAKFNLVSDSANDGEGQRGAVESDFGVNRVPTVEEVEKALQEAIEAFNNALGVSDTRLVTMGDFGIAEPRDMIWPSRRSND